MNYIMILSFNVRRNSRNAKMFHLDIEGIDVGDVLAATRPLYKRLGRQVEQGVAVLPERRPQDVHLRLLDIAGALILHLDNKKHI